jgi:hypothetical protein
MAFAERLQAAACLRNLAKIVSYLKGLGWEGAHPCRRGEGGDHQGASRALSQ